MLPFVRLYGSVGCPHCERAAQFLLSRKIPLQAIVVANDPVAVEGLKKVLGSDVVSVPALVVFKEQPEVILGFQEGEYERVASLFPAGDSQQPPSAVVPDGPAAGEGSTVPQPDQLPPGAN